MILTEVTKQIKSVYPLYDDTFSQLNPILGYSYLNGQLNIVTDYMHGLHNSNFVVIDGIKAAFPFTVDNYDPQTGILTIILNRSNQLFYSDKTVTIKGFNDNNFNGTFPLIEITYTGALIQLPTGLILDTTDLNPKFTVKSLVNYVNGAYKIINVPDQNTIVINCQLIEDSKLDLTDAVIKTSRVAAIADMKQTFALKKDTISNPEMWVELSAMEIDGALFGGYTAFNINTQRVQVVKIISIYAIYPIVDSNTAYETVDLLTDRVYKVLIKCIANTWRPTMNVWDEGVLAEGEGNLLAIGPVTKYHMDNSLLIYRFNFNYAVQITTEDGFDLYAERPLKRFEIDVNDIWIDKEEVPQN